jgi:hypothetical protein
MASLPTGTFENAELIYKALLKMGLSTDAAAGVAGNIYQESHGNPGSSSGVGGGLFGEELQNGGTVSGGTLTEQLAALAKYIAANGSISDINAHASSPAAAATYFCNQYERPGTPDLANRTAAAEWVAEAAKSGNWGSSSGSSSSSSSSSSDGGGPLSFPSEITGFFGDAEQFVNKIAWLTMPASWLRIAAFLAGVALILIAIYAFVSVGEGSDSIMPHIPSVMPVPV